MGSHDILSAASIDRKLARREDGGMKPASPFLAVQEIRQKNLEVLIREAGSSAALAKRMKSDASYVSQLKGGHRGIGDKAARKLERATNKPYGWLDSEHRDAWGQLLMARAAGRPVFTADNEDAKRAWLQSVLNQVSEDDLQIMIAVAVRSIAASKRQQSPDQSQE